MLASDKTNYPGIYDRTYWGHFVPDKNTEITEKIIENRNKFVEDLKITKCKSIDDDELIKIFTNNNINTDHKEWYETEDGKIILITSPYGESDALKHRNGWIKI